MNSRSGNSLKDPLSRLTSGNMSASTFSNNMMFPSATTTDLKQKRLSSGTSASQQMRIRDQNGARQPNQNYMIQSGQNVPIVGVNNGGRKHGRPPMSAMQGQRPPASQNFNGSLMGNLTQPSQNGTTPQSPHETTQEINIVSTTVGGGTGGSRTGFSQKNDGSRGSFDTKQQSQPFSSSNTSNHTRIQSGRLVSGPQIYPNQLEKQSDSATNPTNMTTYVEKESLDRIGQLQKEIRRTWKGIQTQFSGRPGTSNLVNSKRRFEEENEFVDTQDRLDLYLRCLMRLKEITESKAYLSESREQTRQQQSSLNRNQMGIMSATASGFRRTMNEGGFSSSMTKIGHQAPWGMSQLEYEEDQFIYFQSIGMGAMLNSPPPQLGYAHSYNNIKDCELLYKIFRGDTKLVRSLLEANQFSHTESHEWNILWSSGSCKGYLYEGLNEFQKINHFPSSFEITRKDKLSQNIARMQQRFGKAAFDFLPDTYVIPDEFSDFYAHFQKLKASSNDARKNMWIVKPANMSRGRGIYLIDDVSEVSVDDLSIISRYISNPLLINGHKFDLRIYVLVTSVDPLRIYVFKEGLARFASQVYQTKAGGKGNKFVHLTNYSINKKSQNYVQNDNLEEDDSGFKWSLSAFCNHLEQIKIDMDLFWSRIYDIIIKSFLAGESHIYNACKKTCIHNTNCFELYGFDIMIDSDFKPWLIEINLSPSLACDSQIDMKIKGQLLADTFNLVGVKQFDRKVESANKAKNRMKSYQNRGRSFGAVSSKMNNMFNPLRDVNNMHLGGAFQNFMTRGVSANGSRDGGGRGGLGNNDHGISNFTQVSNPHLITHIDETLSRESDFANNIDLVKRLSMLKHKEVLKETLLEMQRMGNFVCIYPSKGSEMYDQYFLQARPYNKFVQRVLFQENLLENLILPPSQKQDNINQNNKKQSASNTNQTTTEQQRTKADQNNKMVVRNQYPANLGVKPSQNMGQSKSCKEMKEQQHPHKRKEYIHEDDQNTMNETENNQSPSRKMQSVRTDKGGNSNAKLKKSLEKVGGGGSASRLQSSRDQEQPGFSPVMDGSVSERPSQKKSRKGIKLASKTGTVNNTLVQTYQLPNEDKANGEKVIVSGDDILIEYTQRLVKTLQQIADNDLRPTHQAQLLRFITHFVWQYPDKSQFQGNMIGQNSKTKNRPTTAVSNKPGVNFNQQSQNFDGSYSYAGRISNRMIEMRDRRRRLIKMNLRKMGKSQQEIDQIYKQAIFKKNKVLNCLDARSLEHSLIDSTRNIAVELVSTLVPSKESFGILIDLETSFDLNSFLKEKTAKSQASLKGDMSSNYSQKDLSPDLVNSGFSRVSHSHKQQVGQDSGSDYLNSDTVIRPFGKSPLDRQQRSRKQLAGGTFDNRNFQQAQNVKSDRQFNQTETNGASDQPQNLHGRQFVQTGRQSVQTEKNSKEMRQVRTENSTLVNEDRDQKQSFEKAMNLSEMGQKDRPTSEYNPLTNLSLASNQREKEVQARLQKKGDSNQSAQCNNFFQSKGEYSENQSKIANLRTTADKESLPYSDQSTTNQSKGPPKAHMVESIGLNFNHQRNVQAQSQNCTPNQCSNQGAISCSLTSTMNRNTPLNSNSNHNLDPQVQILASQASQKPPFANQNRFALKPSRLHSNNKNNSRSQINSSQAQQNSTFTKMSQQSKNSLLLLGPRQTAVNQQINTQQKNQLLGQAQFQKGWSSTATNQQQSMRVESLQAQKAKEKKAVMANRRMMLRSAKPQVSSHASGGVPTTNSLYYPQQEVALAQNRVVESFLLGDQNAESRGNFGMVGWGGLVGTNPPIVNSRKNHANNPYGKSSEKQFKRLKSAHVGSGQSRVVGAGLPRQLPTSQVNDMAKQTQFGDFIGSNRLIIAKSGDFQLPQKSNLSKKK